MKNAIYFVMLFVTFKTFGQDYIENLKFKLSAENIIVTYDIPNYDLKNAKCYYRVNNGSFQKLRTAKGDCNSLIKKGYGKQIVWFMSNDIEGINGDIQFKVVGIINRPVLAPEALYGQKDNIDENVKSLTNARYFNYINTKLILDKIEVNVNKEIESWQEKGKYEKLVDYQKRVNEESRIKKIEDLTQQNINEFAIKYVSTKVTKTNYDSENEVFQVFFPELNPIYLKVPIANGEAESFDKALNKLIFSELNFAITPLNRFALLNCKITNPVLNKNYYYNHKTPIKFMQQEIIANFDPINVNIKKEFDLSKNEVSEEKVAVGKSDVDINIPNSSVNYNNKYALIIGNEDYTKYQPNLNSESNVLFAKNDAEVFALYCKKTLGIPSENIVLITDAISSQMKREIEKLVNLAKYNNGKAELYFYYAGHGFPDDKTNESYLIPVDITAADVTNGIKLSDLFDKLSTFPTKRTIMFLDACFSGGGRNQGILPSRGVKINPKTNDIKGNLLVFSASSGDQKSLPYMEKKHGIFTYYLLKKIQESKGEITFGNLSNYVTDNVQINAIKINNLQQNPQVQASSEIEGIWREWMIK